MNPALDTLHALRDNWAAGGDMGRPDGFVAVREGVDGGAEAGEAFAEAYAVKIELWTDDCLMDLKKQDEVAARRRGEALAKKWAKEHWPHTGYVDLGGAEGVYGATWAWDKATENELERTDPDEVVRLPAARSNPAARKPLDKDLYEAVKEEAKRKFDVWPSAYASGWVVKTYKARGGRYAGGDKKTSSGLTKWFGESWVDLSRPIFSKDGELTGYEPCGRKTAQGASNDPAAYPKCRPLKEAMRMTPAQVKDAIKRKRAAEAKAAKGRGGRGARAPVRVATYRANPRAQWFHGGSADDVQQVKELGHFPSEYAPRQDNWGAGVYLTSSKKEAKKFGDAVIGVNVAPSVKLLDMRDPTYRAMPSTVFDKLHSAKAKAAFQEVWYAGDIGGAVRAGVLADGYDGIVWKGDDWNDWAVVFDPTQVMHKARANPDVVLYHRTTPANAAKIVRERRWMSREQPPYVFFSTDPHGHGTSYGEALLEVVVPEAVARLDDEFPSGEQHYAVLTRDLAGLPVRLVDADLRSNPALRKKDFLALLAVPENRKAVEKFVDVVRAYQSDSAGYKSDLANRYLALPASVQDAISEPKANLKKLYRADDGKSRARATSWTSSLDYAKLFGQYVFPYAALASHGGTINMHKLVKLLDFAFKDHDVGDDEDEVVILEPVWKSADSEDGYLVKNVKGYWFPRENPDVRRPRPRAREEDMLDAIQHADVYGDQGWTLDDFTILPMGEVPLSRVLGYEDCAWLDVDPEDFAGMSAEERLAELSSFRGPKWAARAAEWLSEGVPPIVVIDAPVVDEAHLYRQIGDGRGRVNFALAMGLKTLPVVIMKWKHPL